MRRLALALALPALAACGGDSGPAPVDGGTAISVPAQESDTGDGPDGLVGGVVEFEEDTGCVVLAVGETRYPVVWPAGTSGQRDSFQLVLEDGRVIREGDAVEGSGGFPSESEGADLEATGIPPECLEGPGRSRWGEVAVLNSSSDLVVRP
jgi:hypothetical protein